MRYFIFLSTLILIGCATSKKVLLTLPIEQETVVSVPEFSLQEKDVRMPLQFLASDELQGRNTGTIYSDIAARFIAEQFEYFGVQPIEDTYFQEFDLIKKTAYRSGELVVGSTRYEQGENMLLVFGKNVAEKIEVVYVEHGWVDIEKGIDDYKELDVTGKLVVTIPGTSKAVEVNGFADGIRYLNQKMVFAREKGALGLVEIFPYGVIDWNIMNRFQNSPQMSLVDLKDNPFGDFIGGVILPDQPDFLSELKGKITLQDVFLKFDNKTEKEPIRAKNVVGLIEGTDSLLKEEYIILTAHYDHVGVQSNIENTTDVDTIFNGSRDDGMGTVALLSAAKTLSQAPPKRSVILVAFSGEEKGLLGSQFYVEHPLIPLKQTVFNLNSDGTSYNNTALVTIFGHDQFDDLSLLTDGCQPFDLTINADPAPQENLFTRSDNFSFANKGIPAPTFAFGFDNFDDEKVRNYYHQVIDNPSTIDYDYLLRFSQAFSHTARLLGNAKKLPYWKSGNHYEKAGNTLYEK